MTEREKALLFWSRIHDLIEMKEKARSAGRGMTLDNATMWQLSDCWGRFEDGLGGMLSFAERRLAELGWDQELNGGEGGWKN